MKLDLFADAADLTAQLVDIESVSGAEGPIADAIEAALRRAAPSQPSSGTATRWSRGPGWAGRSG